MNEEGGDLKTGKRKSKTGNRHSFTLIELLVVIMIIALLAGLLLPALIAARNYARVAKTRGETREIAKAWQSYWDAYRQWPGGITEMNPDAVAILQGRGHSMNTNDLQFMAFSRREETQGSLDPWRNRYRVQFSATGIKRETRFHTRVYTANRHRYR